MRCIGWGEGWKGFGEKRQNTPGIISVNSPLSIPHHPTRVHTLMHRTFLPSYIRPSAKHAVCTVRSSSAMSDVVRFTNGYILLPDGSASTSDLYISPSQGTIISGQDNFYTHHLPPARVVNLQGQIIAPGLIDVQINGAYGVDFSELSLEDGDGGEERYIRGLEKVAKRIVETGCTSLVPTIITQEEALYAKVGHGP